jgi:hypothetical protein
MMTASKRSLMRASRPARRRPPLAWSRGRSRSCDGAVVGEDGDVLDEVLVAVGAAVDVRTFTSRDVVFVGVALTVVAILGKFAAGYAATWIRANKKLIGVGMIPRGEVGLIFAQTGLTAGVLTSGTFSALMLMVLVTTFMAPPLLRQLIAKSASNPADHESTGVAEMTTEA